MVKEKVEGLKELLRYIEKLKSDVMGRILELDDNAVLPPLSTVYPGAKAKPKQVNGYAVFQFSYEGVLPLYQQDRDYRAAIRHYYFRATFEAYERNDANVTFNKAAVLIIHYFKDKIVRDLDNRNRKFLLDAIRQTGLIRDDSWRDLAVMEEGFYDPHGDHIQMYVTARENFADFLIYMENQHRQEVMLPDLSLKTAVFEDIEHQQTEKYEGEKAGETKKIDAGKEAEYRNMWS